jgi:hypothetical protein
VELGPVFDPQRIPDKLAWQLAASAEAASAAGDLPDRIDAAIGARKGPLAAKALLRAARRSATAGRGDDAQAHLAAARELPDLQPEMLGQIEATAKSIGQAQPAAAPAFAPPSAPAAASAPSPTPAPAATADAPQANGAGSVRILACKLVRVADDALHVELTSGKTRRVEFNRVVGVKAGVVATPQGSSILTDFVLSWGEAGQGPSAIRIPGAQLGLAALFPGIPSKDAYSKLLAHILARTLGEPQPSREAFARGEYPRFPSVAALNAAFYGGAF